MTTYRSKTALVALCVTAVAATLTGAAGATATAAVRDAATATPPALAWAACAHPGHLDGQQCAKLSVPLDYADPAGPQVDLAVSRLPSTRPAARRGTLAVVPGGPGGSGVQRLSQKGAALAGQLAGAYDLVALDPRGVGGSVTAGCGLDAADRRLTTLRSWPGADGGIAENAERSRRVAEACAANGGAVLRSFTTANQARDMDRFREALGERRLSVWAVSYGTYVTAVYAQKFPQRTDRLVLDSSGDPDPKRVARGWLANMAQGADDRFPDFAAWAVDPARAGEGLRIAEHPDDVKPLFLALAEKLDRSPKPSNVPGLPLTGTMLRQALQTALYGDAQFPAFARLVREARDPKAVPQLPQELAAVLPDSDAALMVGVICNDVAWPKNVSSYERAVAADRAAHPLTAGMPANVTPCAFWKDAPAERPTRITDRGPSNILMVQNLRDPSTPYAASLKMREALGPRARLLTVDHGGHGVYLGNGNACSDRTVTAYLTTGERPARDSVCPS
ncbi:alpha/beta hydrolase [Streptomyces sp. NBC_01264]|uniref:alpha/beta hydrolase n=1 Tax=Streptomyces sp. NBC_01264 TaxID=2903804 RepID=UPI0022508648|nr:alpha/beta hydrolase [Streptomyces sp. NBC_01264]MCX4779820.1 alpha/beta hydrolase [Streptomyces sp. NBC_01264]